MAAKLANLLGKAEPPESCCKSRPERSAAFAFAPDCVAQDLAHLFLGAAAVTARAALQFLLDVVIELADYELCHADMISR